VGYPKNELVPRHGSRDILYRIVGARHSYSRDVIQRVGADRVGNDLVSTRTKAGKAIRSLVVDDPAIVKQQGKITSIGRIVKSKCSAAARRCEHLDGSGGAVKSLETERIAGTSGINPTPKPWTVGGSSEV